MAFRKHRTIEKRKPYKILRHPTGDYTERIMGGHVWKHTDSAPTKNQAAEIAKINRFHGMPSRVVEGSKGLEKYHVYTQWDVPIEQMKKAPSNRLGYERGRSRRF